jgi:hypothetical protein
MGIAGTSLSADDEKVEKRHIKERGNEKLGSKEEYSLLLVRAGNKKQAQYDYNHVAWFRRKIAGIRLEREQQLAKVHALA